MSDEKRLLDLRKKIRAKRPNFKRYNSHKHKKLNDAWRRPKGITSKLRLRRKGKGSWVTPGHGTPFAVRHLSSEGLKVVMVANVNDLNKINPKIEGALIASVGAKKKIQIIEQAKKLSIKILNLKNPDQFVKQTLSELQARKEDRKKRLHEKEDKTKKEVKKEKKEEKEDKTGEEKKIEDKKKMDEALIHRS